MTDSKALLKAFIERETDDLRRILRSYVVRFWLAPPYEDDDITDEVLNEVVVAALKAAARYDPKRRPMPWLLGIGINIIRSRCRHDTRMDQIVLHDDEVLEMLADQADFDADFTGDKWLTETLAPLTEADRQVIELAVLHDLDSETVGRALGISAGAVRVRLHRALKRLRGFIQLEASQNERA